MGFLMALNPMALWPFLIAYFLGVIPMSSSVELTDRAIVTEGVWFWWTWTRNTIPFESIDTIDMQGGRFWSSVSIRQTGGSRSRLVFGNVEDHKAIAGWLDQFARNRRGIGMLEYELPEEIMALGAIRRRVSGEVATRGGSEKEM